MKKLILSCAFCALLVAPAFAMENTYSQTNFVSSKAKFKPALGVEKDFINAWGLAIRPKGAGGHFWVTAKDTSYEYIGDVKDASDETLRKLHQEPTLKTVVLPVGGSDKFATSVVFSDSKENFVLTQIIPDKEQVTAPAKFLFASDGGIISAWTERKLDNGTFDRPVRALPMIDASASGAQFFGLAISQNYDRLYAADFGAHPAIRVYDGKFKPMDIKFDQPFDDNKNGVVDPGEYAPFNIQALTSYDDHHIFVSYAKTQSCPEPEIKKGACKKDELFVGEEDTSKPGQGRVAEFTEDGKLVQVWKDGGHLSAPWGMAFAPENFGPFSNMLLVGNFGDGTIAVFNTLTHEFVDVLRKTDGNPVVIDKIWAILFGNGESLGDANALYFAAGPNDEQDGLFGSLRLVE